MAALNLALDSFWVEKSHYDDAERKFYEQHGNENLTPLAAEVAKARQRLLEMKLEVEDGALEVCSNKADTCSKHVSTESIKEIGMNEHMQNEAAIAVEAKTEVKVSKIAVDVPDLRQNVAGTSMNTIAAAEVRQGIPVAELPCDMAAMENAALKFFEKKMNDVCEAISTIQEKLQKMNSRLSSLETRCESQAPMIAVCPQKPAKAVVKDDKDDDDDDVDLFGSESDDDETAAKVKEERLAAYNAKKSKKPVLIAKSSIILDVKPWDDETDMKAMEVEVRKIECDGLLWGASKLVPLAFGICKLQINCVVEDEKVSIDWLQEQIEANEDFVQSVDIAAFNKI